MGSGFKSARRNPASVYSLLRSAMRILEGGLYCVAVRMSGRISASVAQASPPAGQARTPALQEERQDRDASSCRSLADEDLILRIASGTRRKRRGYSTSWRRQVLWKLLNRAVGLPRRKQQGVRVNQVGVHSEKIGVRLDC